MIDQISNLKRQLHQPYPYSCDLRGSFKTILFISVFVFLFVLIFRSDQIPGAPTFLDRLFHSSYYGLITFFGASLNSLILDQFISQKQEQNWNVMHEILVYLIHFMTISISVYFLNAIIYEQEFIVLNFITSVMTTVIVGAIPVSIHVILEQQKLLKLNLAAAKNIALRDPHQDLQDDQHSIEIDGQQLILASLIYVESDKNYLRINSSELGDIRYRATIKDFSNMYTDCNFIIRCHRAFLVNINFIEKVSGNAQGLTLFLNNGNTIIPVSRRYIAELKSMI